MAEIWQELYPFAENALSLDGLRYHYLDEGRGEPILFVHGNPTWSFYWRNLLLGLRDDYRCIAVDHIGCGLSDKPARYRYELAQHVDNLGQLIERLDLRGITLVAHDWGGAIGLGAAVALPDRFRRLVLMNTAAFRSDQMPWRIRMCRTPMLGKIAMQGMNAFARAALRMAVVDCRCMTAQVRAGYLAPYDTWSHRRAIHEFVQDIPMSPQARSYNALAEVESGLHRLTQLPVLLVWGMQDWCFTPQFLARFRQFFPAAEVREVRDAGHYVVEEAHDRIVPWLRSFLARHPIAQGHLSPAAMPTASAGLNRT